MPAPDTVFYNINFPALTADQAKGMCVCEQGVRDDATFSVTDYTAPNGREFQFLRHMIANHSAPEGSDARRLVDGWVTITPLRPNLTARDLMADAAATLENS